jgi:hypothetical protein
MPTIITVKNPLEPSARETHEVGRTSIIDWLQANYPDGFGAAITLNLNGKKLEIDDADTVIDNDDLLLIAATPRGFEAMFINFLVSTAISMVAGMLFKKPQPPAVQRMTTPAADPVYSIGTAQNSARLSEPVPAIYGQIITTPDLASQPYTYYENNEQYLCQILCIGAGEYQIDEVLIGETPADQVAAGTFQYWVYPESKHTRKMGVIFNDTTVMENVVTSSEVSDHEISATGATTAGWFMVCAPHLTVNRLSLDFIWPSGLYTMNSTNGAIQGNSVQLKIWYEQVDAAGVASGIIGQHTFTVSRSTNTPQRQTESIDVAPARYRVKVDFLSGVSTSSYDIKNTHWAALKGRVPDLATPVYGPVTLLVTKTKATNGISNDASSRIRAKVTRKLAPLGVGAPVATKSPADAYYDILANTDYGARCAADSIDSAELSTLKAHWGAEGEFNAAFSSKSTVYEAIASSLQTVMASPISTGHVMSAAQDGAKANRVLMFSDMNIIRGTLKVQYTFDRIGDYDGIEVKYRNPETFNTDFVRYPTSSAYPDSIDFFGCSNRAYALNYARFEFQRRGLARKSVEFETELEGLIPRPGDRISVTSVLPRWGRSGEVIEATWPVVRLDGPMDWTGSNHVIMFRNQDGTPSVPMPCRRQAIPDNLKIIIDGFPNPPFPIYTGERQDSTHYAFGTSDRLLTDFVVQKIEHMGGVRVRIMATVYNEDVFKNSFTFLVNPT